MIGKIGQAIGAVAHGSGTVLSYPQALKRKSFLLKARFQETLLQPAKWITMASILSIYDTKYYIHLEINKMFAQEHVPLRIKMNEDVELIFTVTDEQGDAVSLVGATATFRVARHQNTPMILEKNNSSGVTIVGHEVKVLFNASEIEVAGTALKGDFVDQLVITKDGKSICVSEGRITIEPLIA